MVRVRVGSHTNEVAKGKRDDGGGGGGGGGGKGGGGEAGAR